MTFKRLKILTRIFLGVGMLSWAGQVQAAVINATFSAASDIPVTASGYQASGSTINFTLNFAPAVGTSLTVVKNTGLPFIQGTFDNLAQGQAVDLSFAGTTYHFVANYFGGSGNDLVLLWANTRLVAWGDNDEGQLGNNGSINSRIPAAVINLGALAGKTVTDLAAGYNHSLALCSDGTILAWGDNSQGQLGNNGTTQSSVPVAVIGSGALANKTVISISAGTFFSVALCSDGTVFTWGRGSSGQLGNNSNGGSLVPVAVIASGALSGKSVVAISTGNNSTLALCSDGTLVTWGFGPSGLGTGTTTVSYVPIAVDSSGVLAGKTVTAIAGGSAHCLILCSDGTLAAWGLNGDGQLGNNGTTSSYVPVSVDASGALSGKIVTAIAAGQSDSLVLCSDGTLAGWGYNGQTRSSTPVLVEGTGALSGKIVTAITAGTYHLVTLSSDGTGFTWGLNNYGQLGNDSQSNSSVPVVMNTGILNLNENLTKILSGSSSYFNLGIVASPENSPAPIITSTGTSSGTLSSMFGGYNIVATNNPGFYAAANLPSGLNLNSSTGLISGTPTSPGVFYSTISATNAGGTTTAPLTFTIAKQPATVALGNLSAVYDTLAKPVTVTTTPPGLAVNVTYNGSALVPGSPGSYAVVATVNSSTYQGSAAGTLVIASSSFSLNATFFSTATVPLTIASNYYPRGSDLRLDTAFDPSPGVNLTIVKSTGGASIIGTFDSLAQGQLVTFDRGSNIYTYYANYFGGAGHDLVLQWANVKPMAWGLNNYGQLGNPGSGGSSLPVPVKSTGALKGKTVTALAAGQEHSLAVLLDGTVMAWGGNEHGQLGTGTTTAAMEPVPVFATGALAGKQVVAVSAGVYHSVALCSDGSTADWGNDGGGGAVKYIPTLASSRNVVAISAGGYHTLALDSNGGVLAWGSNTLGQLGITSVGLSAVPVYIGQPGALSGKRVTAVAAGLWHSLALCSDGTMVSWGLNNRGQLGNGIINAGSVTPVEVYRNGALAGKTVIAIAAGGYQNVALCSDGTLVAWGGGNNMSNSTYTGNVPVLIPTGLFSGSSIISISADFASCYALGANGVLANWSLPYSSISAVNLNTASGERYQSVVSGSSSSHVLGLLDVSKPAITSPSTASGVMGKPLPNYALVAVGTRSGLGISGLPNGLSFDASSGIISGTPTQYGSFPLTLTAYSSYGNSTAPLTLTIGLTSLDSFRVNNNLNLDGSSDVLKPAGDGVPNLLKYAFNMVGGGQGQAVTLDLPNNQNLAVTGSAGLPSIGLDSSNRIVVTYVRRKASAEPGVNYAVEFSNDLADLSWTVNSSATESVTSIDANFERVTITDNVTNAGKRFGRVRVMTP